MSLYSWARRVRLLLLVLVAESLSAALASVYSWTRRTVLLASRRTPLLSLSFAHPSFAHSRNRGIHFKINWDKAVEAVHYLTSIHPGITPYYIANIIYFADKQHMPDWGRPICGDSYEAMENGPVPSNVSHLIKREPCVDDDIIQEFVRRIEIEEHYRSLRSKIEFNAVALSRSDMECLRQAEQLYGHMTVDALRDRVHRERAWIEARERTRSDVSPMQMELMIGDDVAHREELINELSYNAAYAG